MAQQEVVEAVIGARDEDRDALAARGVAQPPGHAQAPGHLRDRGLEARAVGAQLGGVEVDALEEDPRDGVGVLVGVEDVGAVPVEELGERRDDAALVGAGDQQRGGRVWSSLACGSLRETCVLVTRAKVSESRQKKAPRAGAGGPAAFGAATTSALSGRWRWEPASPLPRFGIRLVALGRRHLTRRSTALVHRITSVSA